MRRHELLGFVVMRRTVPGKKGNPHATALDATSQNAPSRHLEFGTGSEIGIGRCVVSNCDELSFVELERGRLSGRVVLQHPVAAVQTAGPLARPVLVDAAPDVVGGHSETDAANAQARIGREGRRPAVAEEGQGHEQPGAEHDENATRPRSHDSV